METVWSALGILALAAASWTVGRWLRGRYIERPTIPFAQRVGRWLLFVVDSDLAHYRKHTEGVHRRLSRATSVLAEPHADIARHLVNGASRAALIVVAGRRDLQKTAGFLGLNHRAMSQEEIVAVFETTFAMLIALYQRWFSDDGLMSLSRVVGAASAERLGSRLPPFAVDADPREIGRFFGNALGDVAKIQRDSLTDINNVHEALGLLVAHELNKSVQAFQSQFGDADQIQAMNTRLRRLVDGTGPSPKSD